LFFRVRVLEQHRAEGELGEGLVHRIQAHAVNKAIDQFHRRIFSQIDDHALAAGLQHAAHFLQCANGLAEVLESRAANQEIEGVVGERHAGCVALAEVYADAAFGCLLTCDLDKGVADVESGDGEGA